MSDDLLVRVEGLSRRYGEQRVVDDLSFNLAKGQILGFLGPNGAGKSTALRMLAGVLAPDAGRIVIDGHDLLDEPRRAKQAIGYLPERPPLYQELTVDEQLQYSARLHGLGRAAARSGVARVKERCGLTGVGKRLNANLSKGYQQRVGIAQAILHDPPAIFLDEPTVGLDPLQVQEIRTLIGELKADHGVILSTHLLVEVQATCTDVHIIKAGRSVYASPLALLEQHRASGCLRVGLRAPPPPAALRQLAGVERVEELGQGRFRLHHAPEVILHRAVLEQSRARNWDLWELVPERADLERIFVELMLAERSVE
ncbi:MAG: ATP-binding cassette domain-containing protein [Candidatus Competibacteraceae bacterium]|nr:ATP-binding cassette domain-containing protein [Candidatus Competibacteraceae bacterium]